MKQMEIFNILITLSVFLIFAYNTYLGFNFKNYPAMLGWFSALFLFVALITK